MEAGASGGSRPPRGSSLPLSLPPLGLHRVQAAELVGVSPSKFDELVKTGRMPRARHIDGRAVWVRVHVERAFYDLIGDDEQPDQAKSTEWDVAE